MSHAHAMTRDPSAGPPLDAARWGMAAFLVSEAAFFCTLVVAYLTFLGRDTVGPTPREALSLPLVLATTACLLSSSVTVHRAGSRLDGGDVAGFRTWWWATVGLGLVFLAGTGYEWFDLVTGHHLTVSRNLFGSTYYTLVGFHGLHVSAGVATMILVALAGPRPGRDGVALVSWYWHFVDAVWVVVFSVVYLFGR